MRTGRHFCEFTLAGQGGISGGGNITHAGGDIGCWVGVVPASFDPRDGVPAINATPSGWLLYTQDCQLFRSASTRGVAVAQPGDVVGLLLSLSETEVAQQDVRGDETGDHTEAAGDGSFSGGSLTVFLNGTRCGVRGAVAIQRATWAVALGCRRRVWRVGADQRCTASAELTRSAREGYCRARPH
jgi:hypothetical protein